MDKQRISLQAGAALIICALVFRLMSSGAFAFLLQPDFAAVLLFLETGRLVGPPYAQAVPPETQSTVPSTTAPTQPPPTEPPALPVFSPADASLIQIKPLSGCQVDTAALLQTPLRWNLADGEPAVLILHSHATESYKNTEGYSQSSAYRTHDTNYNMVSVGKYLGDILEAAGIRVIHDTSLHDSPSYDDAYTNSRKSAQAALEKYPTIRMVIDLHRDAFSDSNGNQLGTYVTENGQRVARMMLVMGTDLSGYAHPKWQENLALALKLQAQLEKNTPGICRRLDLRSQRFNQDLCPGAMLVEMGAAGNTRQEALLAAEKLAQAIIDLSRGTG